MGTEQKAKKSNFWRNISIMLAVVAVFTITYLVWPSFRNNIQQAIGILSQADIEKFRWYLRSFGIWAPIVSALIMVLQSILFPLPAFVVTITNGLLFGAFWGTILSWSSAMVGAAVCFAIGRILGRPAVEKMISVKAVAFTDRFFEKYGNNSVLIARLIPVISFDVVSYAAGLTRISFLGFMVATGIGQLPATIVYSIVGENIPTAANLGLWALGGVAALLVLGFSVKKAMEKRIVKPTDTIPEAPKEAK